MNLLLSSFPTNQKDNNCILPKRKLFVLHSVTSLGIKSWVPNAWNIPLYLLYIYCTKTLFLTFVALIHLTGSGHNSTSISDFKPQKFTFPRIKYEPKLEEFERLLKKNAMLLAITQYLQELLPDNYSKSYKASFCFVVAIFLILI